VVRNGQRNLVAAQHQQNGRGDKTMDIHAKKKSANFFAAAFAESLAQSVAAETGSAWPLGVMRSPDAPINKGTPVHFRLAVEGSIAGECFIEFYEPQVSGLVSKILKQPVTELADEHCEALVKVLTSATTGLAASLSAKYGALSFKVERVGGLAFGGMFVVSLAASEDESNARMESKLEKPKSQRFHRRI
jgi:hypothetical protein